MAFGGDEAAARLRSSEPSDDSAVREGEAVVDADRLAADSSVAADVESHLLGADDVCASTGRREVYYAGASVCGRYLSARVMSAALSEGDAEIAEEGSADVDAASTRSSACGSERGEGV